MGDHYSGVSRGSSGVGEAAAFQWGRLKIAGGKSHATRLVNLSDGGAFVRDAPAMRVGDRGTLEIDAVGAQLSFFVRYAEDGTLRIAFALDEAGSARLTESLAGLPRRRAA
jgi:hypothetical protein